MVENSFILGKKQFTQKEKEELGKLVENNMMMSLEAFIISSIISTCNLESGKRLGKVWKRVFQRTGN